MPLFLNIFLIVSLIVNYLPALRFSKNKYFVYFFVAALIDPIHITIVHFFKVNSYPLLPFICPVLLLTLPKKDIKHIIFSFISILILLPHFYDSKLIPLFISTISGCYIIFLLCEDLFDEIKNNSHMPLFLALLIMEFLRGIIKNYLYYENLQLMIQYFSVFMILEIVTIILIAYFGPSANVRIRLKKGIVDNDESIKPKPQTLHLIQIPGNGSFHGLTNMEMKVLSFLSEGYDSKEISQKLFVTPGAVYFHLGNIKNKLQISKTCYLAKYAIENREKIEKISKPVKIIV